MKEEKMTKISNISMMLILVVFFAGSASAQQAPSQAVIDELVNGYCVEIT
jgi:hypothetical protein